MENLVTIIHVLASAGVIGLVLLQHGKGADMGAAFGSGASGSLFGVSGSSNFLSRATAACVVVFFLTSLTLAYMASHKSSGSVVKAAGSVVNVPAEKSVDVKPIEPTPVETPAGSAAKDVPN
jgi:preprotein translocase subunit SecG